MILDLLHGHAAERPHALALADPEHTLTWSQLVDRVAERARELAPAPGVRPGIAALHRPGDCRWVIDFLALRSCGHPVLPLPEAMPAATAEALARDMGATLLVSANGAGRLPGPEPAEADTDPIALVHLTSGTTGTAKGVLRSAANIEDEAAAVAQALGLGPEHPVLTGTPVSHSFASGLLTAALRAGAPTLLTPRYDPAGMVRMAHEHRPGTMCGTPYVFRAVARAKEVRRSGLPGLRHPLSGGAPLHPSWAEAWQQVTGVPICQEYGLSEGGIATMNLAARPDTVGSVGLPVPGVTVRVLGPDGSPLGAGQAGRVVIDRPATPAHYLTGGGGRAPVPTAPALPGDGPGASFVETGDLGSLDEHGRLRLTGRTKVLINVAGAKVSPFDVEHHLLNSPSVKDAVVAGVPDPDRGEMVAALVHADPGTTTSELAKHLRERLSSFAVPRRWVFTSDIPRTASGKPDRARVLAILEG
ncbi:class I adenylate-forming enzyme family protein [Streptomyces sp. NBC_00525]|uniref:class I adenylate-forming enzyme family protein n=1 Tax=Streptomyces sp. NBC_00525 TaxID=2903660 RepID=UPI002E8147F9|nr:AMP-binding protein [Streptomyces sp. NBC_00525]WUC96722.1 AMP-binding protein [Streptomyces sp. NBC_00525]